MTVRPLDPLGEEVLDLQARLIVDVDGVGDPPGPGRIVVSIMTSNGLLPLVFDKNLIEYTRVPEMENTTIRVPEWLLAEKVGEWTGMCISRDKAN